MSGRDESPGEDGDMTAAEHALGVLEGAERQAAEHRLAADPHYARDVGAWETRLTGLIDEVRAEPPPTGLWAQIVRRLEGGGAVVELRLRRSLALWRGGALAAMAVAATLAVVVVMPHPQPAAAPVLTARLTGTKGPTVFVAVFNPNQHEIMLMPATVTASPDRSPELWLIPVGGKPISLGVAAFQRAVKLSPDARIQGFGSGTLAISIEPKGGSPTGQPTGPVVATGQLEKL